MPDVDAHNSKLDAAEGLDVATKRPIRLAAGRYIRNRGALVSTVVMFLIVLAVTFTTITARYGINEQVIQVDAANGIKNQYLAPSKMAWMGTDNIGRDIYSRLLYGTRSSLLIGVAAGLLSVLIGTAVGVFSGIRGGRIDDFIMRTTDIYLAFPFLVAVIIMRQFLGELGWVTAIIGDRTSYRFVIFLITFFGWMGVARLVRGSVLSLKEREFVEAARAVGASNLRIAVSHLIPNSIGPILVSFSLAVVGGLIIESTLSFFALGPQPGGGSTSLGKLIELSAEGAKAGYWWVVVYPCGMLVLLAVCINFIGDGLRDAFDPKLDKGKV
ncbi:MAG: ABC transporter permease [Actinomycetota bacterium]|nr:ABC transporter permease [Actinomycetota bacterium]